MLKSVAHRPSSARVHLSLSLTAFTIYEFTLQVADRANLLIRSIVAGRFGCRGVNSQRVLFLPGAQCSQRALGEFVGNQSSAGRETPTIP